MKLFPHARWLGAIALVVVMVSPSLGAIPGVGFGVQGGWGRSKDADKGSPIAGAHVVINVAPWLGLVGMADMKFPEDYKSPYADYTVKSFPLSATARVYIPLLSFNPYLTGGVQYRLINYGGDLFRDTKLDDSDTSFGWVAGAGAGFALAGVADLFGEFRYEASDVDRDINNAVQDVKDFKYDQWTARAGVTFFF